MRGPTDDAAVVEWIVCPTSAVADVAVTGSAVAVTAATPPPPPPRCDVPRDLLLLL